jgi:hypothetical protein
MPIDPAPEDRLQHMASSIEALNVRIARLAIGLGVSLKNDADVAQVMKRHPALPISLERRLAPDTHPASRAGSDTDRRMAHQWEELRGLLVLRYSVETRYVEQVGVLTTRQILVEAEALLVRDGFQPGADGIDLERLFNEA